MLKNIVFRSYLLAACLGIQGNGDMDKTSDVSLQLQQTCVL